MLSTPECYDTRQSTILAHPRWANRLGRRKVGGGERAIEEYDALAGDESLELNSSVLLPLLNPDKPNQTVDIANPSCKLARPYVY